MDPISLSSDAAARVRPAPGLAPDLAAVLQQGRVLAGEVLQVFGGGTLVVGVGRHRVTAESQVELALGQRFLFRVEGSGDDLALRLLQGELPEAPLVRALREHLAHERPIGRLLADLAARLRASLAGRGDARDAGGATARLLAELDEHAFRPGSGGAELRALVARSGQGLEAALAAGARAAGDGRPTATMLSAELAAWLAGDGASPDLVGRVEAAVSSVLTEPDARGAEPGALLARIGRALGALLAELPDAASRAALARRAGTLAEGTAPERELALVRGWLGGAPTPARWIAEALAVLVGRDLKARLLNAASALADDEEPLAAARRLLAGVEAEQIVNAGRRASGHGPVLSVPVPDPGGGQATLRIERRDEGASGEGPGGAERLALDIELSHLGPLRADLLWTAERLAVRIVVESDDTARRLREDLVALRDLLDVTDRALHLSVVKGTRAEASLAPVAHGVGWLDDNHLMDLDA